MIDCLIQGRLHAAPVQRMSKTGKPFATARLLAATGDGEPRASLDVVGQQVLTAYAVTRKRQAVQQKPATLPGYAREASH